ncbi:hypothetical protein BaRGS_00020624 [Batillaria attramentaria]|uniref:Uncharacterized protein n=1 Tax=Batillaria attramentaria TaxID=370345 RepID=A0ABD0KM64_9CAEN
MQPQCPATSTDKRHSTDNRIIQITSGRPVAEPGSQIIQSSHDGRNRLSRFSWQDEGSDRLTRASVLSAARISAECQLQSQVDHCPLPHVIYPAMSACSVSQVLVPWRTMLLR